MKPLFRPLAPSQAFSLIELVFAMGLCAVGILSVLGLFIAGIATNRQSQDQIEAANLASLLISARSSSPTNVIQQFAVPSLASAYGTTTHFVGYDGMIAATAEEAVCRVVCESGTNALTGPSLAQLHLMLIWPPNAPMEGSGTKHYEVLTYISLR